MAKKSLGRGLDDISNIFLSVPTDKKILSGFSSKKLRDATCECCTHIFNDPNNVSKCKIFNIHNEKYGVRYMETVSSTSGSYCQYFEPVSPKKEDNDSGVTEIPPDQTEIQCDIEENVSVQRNIAFPDTPEGQKNLLKSFSKHLEQNYSVMRIELTRSDTITQPGIKKCTTEIVTIFIHGGTVNGSHD